MDRARALRSRFPSTGRDAPRATGALRSVCRPALAARKPRLRLLGGFAGRADPKRRMAPAFPQVGNPNGEQPPSKTAQKPRTHGKIGAHFLQNRSEVAGDGPANDPRQQTGARRPMRDSECVWQRFSRHFGCPVPTIWQKNRRCLRFLPSRASRPCPSSCSCR